MPCRARATLARLPSTRTKRTAALVLWGTLLPYPLPSTALCTLPAPDPALQSQESMGGVGAAGPPNPSRDRQRWRGCLLRSLLGGPCSFPQKMQPEAGTLPSLSFTLGKSVLFFPSLSFLFCE